jgi:hypothetical protein
MMTCLWNVRPHTALCLASVSKGLLAWTSFHCANSIEAAAKLPVFATRPKWRMKLAASSFTPLTTPVTVWLRV